MKELAGRAILAAVSKRGSDKLPDVDKIYPSLFDIPIKSLLGKEEQPLGKFMNSGARFILCVNIASK